MKDETAMPEAEPDLVELSRAVEAILMVSPDPVSDATLGQILGVEETLIREICLGLADSYAADERGFEMANVAGGWRYQSHPDLAPVIEKMVVEAQNAKLSGAAMETLAIIAYKQPMSRAQISAIRGVNVDGVLKTLSQRGYVAEIGRDEGPGQAVLFGTTDLFLERLGLSKVQDLPPLGDFVPPAHVVEALEQTLRAQPEAEVLIDLTEPEQAVTHST